MEGNVIQIDHLIFVSKIDSLRTAANGVEPDSASMPESSSEAETLKKYEEKFQMISTLLQNYKNLVLKDISTINSMGESMVAFEKNILKP